MTEWIVCPVCEGEGKHVNPSVDAHGISPEEFAEDLDFAHEYFSGTYDVTCKNCKGRRVVDAKEQAAKDEAWEDELSDRYQRMCESGHFEPGWMDKRW